MISSFSYLPLYYKCLMLKKKKKIKDKLKLVLGSYMSQASRSKNRVYLLLVIAFLSLPKQAKNSLGLQGAR